MSDAKINQIVMRLPHRTNPLRLVNAQVGFIMHETEMIGYRVSLREFVLLIECLGYEARKIQYRNLLDIKGFVISIQPFLTHCITHSST